MTTPQQVYAAVFDFLSQNDATPSQLGARIPDEDRRRRRAVGDKDDTPQTIRPAWITFTMPPAPPVPDIDPPLVPPPPPLPVDPPTHFPGPGGGPGGGIAGMGFLPVSLAPQLTERLAQPVIVAPVDRTEFEDYFSNVTIESFWRLPAGQTVTEDETGATMSTGARLMIDKVSFSDCTATIRLGTIAPESEDTLLVRANLEGALNGYGLRQQEATGNMLLLRFDAGVETVLNTYPGESFGPGDTMALSIQAGDIYVYHNGGLIDIGFDATYSSGYVGVYTPGLSSSALTYFQVQPV